MCYVRGAERGNSIAADRFRRGCEAPEETLLCRLGFRGAFPVLFRVGSLEM